MNVTVEMTSNSICVIPNYSIAIPPGCVDARLMWSNFKLNGESILRCICSQFLHVEKLFSTKLSDATRLREIRQFICVLWHNSDSTSETKVVHFSAKLYSNCVFCRWKELHHGSRNWHPSSHPIQMQISYVRQIWSAFLNAKFRFEIHCKSLSAMGMVFRNKKSSCPITRVFNTKKLIAIFMLGKTSGVIN